MKLLLPLKYYDEAGRVKPSLGLYLCIGFLTRSILVFAGSLSMPQNSSELLRFFYPQQTDLYVGLLGALSALFALLVLGFREKIWASHNLWLFLLLKPFLLVSIFIDLGTHLRLAESSHWMFSWVVATTIMLDLFCAFFIIKDQHTKLMLKDWRTKTRVI